MRTRRSSLALSGATSRQFSAFAALILLALAPACGSESAFTSVDADTLGDVAEADAKPAGPACGLLGVPCPSGFKCARLTESDGYDEFCTREGDDAVFVPAGPFWRGCNASKQDDCAAYNDPAVLVTTPAYLIQRGPVTFTQYERCANDPRGGCRKYGQSDAFDQFSITGLPYEDAVAYCAWRGWSLLEPWRLCSDAEWEKAARGGCETLAPDGDLDACRGSVRLYPWGDEPPNCTLSVLLYQCEYEYPAAGLPAGSRPAGAGPYGVLDMWGGLHELVADCLPSQEIFKAGHYQRPTDGSAWDHDCLTDWSPSGSGKEIRYDARGGGIDWEPGELTTTSSPSRGSRDRIGAFRCCADFDR